MNKFHDIPVEEDTKMLFHSQMKFGDLDIVYEQWYWDGIYGESIIFLNEDVKNKSEEDLRVEVAKSEMVEDENNMTTSRGRKYTFINFNFKIKEDL